MELVLEDLCVSYGSRRHPVGAVAGVSLELPDGGRIGLVGESGCGKTTIARAIVGLAPISSGIIRLDGREIHNPGRAALRHVRENVQLVFQDPYASLNPRMRVRELLLEALTANRARRKAQSPGAVADELERVGLRDELASKFPHQLSGGQRQRVAVARALAAEPRVLIADEITASLDVCAQAALLNMLKDIQQELSLTLLLISHDLAVVRYMCDSVAVMYLGKIVETGPAAAVLAEPRHPYTQALLEAVPRLASVDRGRVPIAGDIPDPANPPTGCRFHPRCPRGPLADPDHSICATMTPQPTSGADGVACHFPLK